MSTPLDAVRKDWKDFLESSPAYVPREFTGLVQDVKPYEPGHTWGIFSPRIQLYCEVDDGVRGFDPSADLRCGVATNHFVRYTCRDCGTWVKTFALILDPDLNATPKKVIAMKLGEFPPFGSHLAERLQDLLSKADLELYRKGIRAEREGQGVGAAAYFRRVVENQWKALVKKLRDAAAKLGASEDSLKVYDEALAQTQFSVAVGVLKDALPAKLLILDGKNPLTLLYKPLSVQIHDLSDEECLQQAADIRTVLNETFDNVSRVLSDDEMLRAAVSRLQGS